MCHRVSRVGVVLLAAIAAAPAWAQVTIPDEYGRHIQQHSEISTMAGQFGDRIDLNSGSLEIVQTDIELPGNGPAVRVGRRYRPSDVYGRGHFNYWDMDIPTVHGTFASVNGWVGTGNTGMRCSHFTAPPAVALMGASWNPDEFWSGSFLYLPGGGEQELLARSGAHVPSDGATYPIVTKAGAAVRCVALAATSESGSSGEGFEVVTPDGTIYTINQMVSRLERPLHKSDPAPMLVAGSESGMASSMQTLSGNDYPLNREEILLFPTRVEDRFGNYVTYTWSTNNPWQLLRIAASDGRQLDFTYLGATDNRVSTISDGGHTWTYAYSGVAGPTDEPDTLTLPDGRAWSYRLARLSYAQVRGYRGLCDTLDPSGGTYVGSVTSPSGATLELTMGAVMFGRSWVYRECIPQLNDAAYAREPYLFVGLAVAKKKITGPGLPTAGLSWTYAYGPPNHCWHPASVPAGTSGAISCTTSSPTTRSVSVTDPDGFVTRHTFGNRYQADEGLLQKVESGWSSTQVLRTVVISYADSEGEPYTAFNGQSLRHMGDYDITGWFRPQQETRTTQQGRTFTWQVPSTCGSNGATLCFDDFARPTKVIKTSKPLP